MTSVPSTFRRAGVARTLSSALDLSSRSLHTSIECTKPSSPLPNLSTRNYHVPKSNSFKRTPSTTYSAFRNKVSVPFEREEGQDYKSPYSDFFANIEAGRSTLGTTEEMERQLMDIEEAYLDCGIPESALRFRTTSYGRFVLPPYVSPGEHRVTVKVPLSAVPFNSPSERDILIQIVGSRYDKERDVVQLSAEKFASRIENKRHLVDMIEQIVAGARRLAKEFEEEDKQSGGSKEMIED